MSDTFSGLLVILDENISQETAEAIINAIRQIKHVLDVQSHATTFDVSIAELRARTKLKQQIWDVLDKRGEI